MQGVVPKREKVTYTRTAGEGKLGRGEGGGGGGENRVSCGAN